MPWLPFYCAPNDLSSLLGLLGDDIAFIVPDGNRRWRAAREFIPEEGSRTALWHIPSGPLAQLGKLYMKPGGIPDAEPNAPVEDPWAGWAELRSGAEPAVPFFGDRDAGVFRLSLQFTGKEPGSKCGVSSFGWTGNRYPDGVPRVTRNRWATLRRHMAKVAQKVPIGGFSTGYPPVMWALPHAVENLDVADVNPR